MLWKCCTQCQQMWKTEQWPQDWKRSVFILIPKKGNDKQCSNYHSIALISHTSKVMLKSLQVRFQQHVNWEFSDVQARFQKRQRNQRSNCQHLQIICNIIKKAREFQKNIYFCFIDYTKAFDSESQKTGRLRDGNMRPPDLLLRNLYAGQEASVQTGHGKQTGCKSGKE